MKPIETPPPATGAADPGRFRRKAAPLASSALVRLAPPPAAGLPQVIEPAAPGVELTPWAEGHRDTIAGWLLAHRALLFRGFPLATVDDFDAFVRASSSGQLLEYRDRSTPRFEVGQRVYVSTVYPAEQSIQLHNEGTYWKRWPLRIYFCSLTMAATGGETPICDVRGVYERLAPAVRERFERDGVLYVRNYQPGVGLSWQDAYQTADRREVEEYCRAQGIACEWLDGERLRTRQRRPAVRRHPATGEPLWFNHGAFFHLSSQTPEVRRELVAAFGEEGLPYQTFYGDGAPIDDAVAGDIRAAYAAGKVIFPWQRGDVLLLDNMTVAHAREPYSGERKVVVAMVDAAEDPS